MKRKICVLLCLALTVFSTACSGNPSDNSESNNAASSAGISGSSEAEASSEDVSSSRDEASAEIDSQTPEDKNTLVVYFSATGSTKAVAETISDTVSADIFEIVPADPYTSDDLDWTNENSRVSIEHNDESKRNVTLTKSVPDNWEQYDTVYIGYPIWWGIAAWPVNGFIEANDFTDKTVIPFCTSASSDIGSSGELLKAAAGNGNWLAGKRFSSNASKEEVKEWLSADLTN